MNKFDRLKTMGDVSVQMIWDAILELPEEEKPDIHWRTLVETEIITRNLRLERKERING